ncbi:MAG: GxxExxY protein [Anaerolineae bacterium]
MTSSSSRKGYDFGLSGAVLGACIDVQRQLGVHCMEVDYQRALALALEKRGLAFEREVEIAIAYDGQVITKRRVDFVVWDEAQELLVETKTRSQILPEDVEQCLLYLRQGHYRLCLLVNFGQFPLGIQRLVHTPNDSFGLPRTEAPHEPQGLS